MMSPNSRTVGAGTRYQRDSPELLLWNDPEGAEAVLQVRPGVPEDYGPLAAQLKTQPAVPLACRLKSPDLPVKKANAQVPPRAGKRAKKYRNALKDGGWSLVCPPQGSQLPKAAPSHDLGQPQSCVARK